MSIAACLSIILISGASVPTGTAAPPAPEQLVVFVSPSASTLARTFQTEHLPSIRDVARELGIPVRVMDVSGGAPPEVALTPLLVFQNHRGRSVYEGRYANIDRIRNFLRTSRVVGQGDEGLTLRDMPVWQPGRSRIAALLKVAAVTGQRPPRHDHDKFTAEAKRAILKGFTKFDIVKSVTLGRGDRRFYLDFNPWLSHDGTLYLSVSLYSQFHCKEPIFTRPGAAFSGPWRDRKRLFRRAAAALEDAIVDTLESSPMGDGFDPVPNSVPSVTWLSLGLELPPSPKNAGKDISGPPLPRRWTLSTKGAGDASHLTFHFPLPLDSYAGEVRSVRGELAFDSGLSVRSVRGHFTADPASVTMGDPDLDHALHGSTFLDVETHGTSKFVIESVDAESAALAYGRQVPVTMRGSFSMKGVTLPLSARAFFEPVIGESGSPRLLLTGRFQLSMAAFSIEGPDGPSPAKDTLILDFRFSMEPASHGK